MKYFFILGNNNALSVAELNALLNLRNPQLLAADFLVADIEEEIHIENVIQKLGGTIKLGIIKEVLTKGYKHDDFIKKAIDIISSKQKKSAEGKFNFGFSGYGDGNFNKKDLGIKIKQYFTEKKISSRFVVSKEKTLSSVVITQNKLLKRGIELVAIQKNGLLYLGETLGVQAFKDLSRRDFGRPARDDASGMLPPKLAMIMINLAQLRSEDSVIVDPFCGSGTVLNEAALMNYKNLFASDISKKAIDDTYTNFSWLKDLYDLKDVNLKLTLKSALKLSTFIKKGFADAIITEPFLGPQRGIINFKVVIENLEELYSEAIKQFREILKPGGRVVMVWPCFYGQRPINPNYDGFKIIKLIPAELQDDKLLKFSERGYLIYSRSKQKVFREIVILEKNK